MNEGLATRGAAGPGLELTQTAAMALNVTPAMVQYAQLLAMGMEQIESLIAAELATNPALEIMDAHRCRACGAPLFATQCIGCWAPSRVAAPASMPINSPAEPASGEAPSLIGDALVELSGFDRRIAEYVLGNLTARGLLDISPARIAKDLAVLEEDVVGVIGRLEEAVAPGFAAPTIEDCLLRQLDALPDCRPEDKELCRQVIAGHLDALARGEIRAVANSVGTTAVRVRETWELIRTHLRPPSGLSLGWGERPIPYATPDVIVTLDGDEPRVEVVERYRFPLFVSEAFTRAPAEPDPRDGSDTARLADLTVRARSFVDRLEGRWRTLQRIAEAAVLFQESFVRNGPEYLRPLTRAQLAAAEGLHESTVSRATRGKFVLLPDRNLIPFGRFFEASIAPKEALRKILTRGEPPQSDEQLAVALAEQGFRMSRRTAAKYRHQMGFPALSAR